MTAYQYHHYFYSGGLVFIKLVFHKKSKKNKQARTSMSKGVWNHTQKTNGDIEDFENRRET